jgi:DIS3-like exonuclease 2
MDGKPQKDVRRAQGRGQNANSHGRGGAHNSERDSRPRRQDMDGATKRTHKANPHEAEENALFEAEAQAQAMGVHHQHVVNTGLSADSDVAHGDVPAPGAPQTGADAAEAGGPVEGPQTVQRPIPRKYTSDPNLPAEVGVRQGTHVVGRLQLKSWTNAVAFVKSPHVIPFDVFVGGIENRSGALPGDLVIVQLKPRAEWKPSTRENNDGHNHVPLLHKPAANQRPTAAAAESGSDDGDEIVGNPTFADGRAVADVMVHAGGERAPADDAERLHRAIGGPDSYDWPRNLQPEGKIVAVLERRFDPIQCCRLFVGHPREGQPEQGPPRIMPDRWYRFKSYSDDFPMVAVYGRDIPTAFRDDVGSYLFLVVIDTEPVRFVDNGRFPLGKVRVSLGMTGTVDAESAAISYTNKIKDAPFSPEVEACVMQDFVIPDAAELKAMGRRDLRTEEFVCTIDPATARDLDDALSITKIHDGYRVGVHIADVSHFVPAGTPLDEEARERATSTYYIERVIPMLPRKLCEDYCSLNAGVDKYAFSGIWNFDYEGNVTDEWFGQSVIRNRCRMAYEDAQLVIEGDESGDTLNFVNEDAPRDELVRKVIKSVKLLQELALKLRQKRFDRGALSLNKGKLKFVFEDFNSRLAPKGLSQERQRAANFLVEEFMLHANCRVAEKVSQFMPSCALLRKHDPPVKKKLNNFIQAARRFGFEIQAGSSKQLRESLNGYSEHPDSDCLRFMATICMSLAKYVSADEDKKNPVNHFALAAPLYTHFTSPIRRYADLVIHRQLLLALDIEAELKKQGYDGYTPAVDTKVDFTQLQHAHYYVHPSDVEQIAGHCNEKKEAAKKAGDASSSLFLCLFIRALAVKSKVEPSLPEKLCVRGVIVRIEEARFTVYMSDVAMTFELHHNSTQQRWKDENKVEEDNTAFVVNWGPHPESGDVTTEKLTLFSEVLVTLDAVVRGHMELQSTVHPPWERDPKRITPLDFEL